MIINEYSNITAVNVTAMLDTYMGEYNRIAWQNGGLANMNRELRVFSGDTDIVCVGYQNILIKVCNIE